MGDDAPQNPVLERIVGELTRYCLPPQQRCDVSGSLSNVLRGWPTQECYDAFDDGRKKVFPEIMQLVRDMLPPASWGTEENYTAWRGY